MDFYIIDIDITALNISTYFAYKVFLKLNLVYFEIKIYFYGMYYTQLFFSAKIIISLGESNEFNISSVIELLEILFAGISLSDLPSHCDHLEISQLYFFFVNTEIKPKHFLLQLITLIIMLQSFPKYSKHNNKI